MASKDMAFPSDLVAALHVPERQREEAERQEEEEGVEHGVSPWIQNEFASLEGVQGVQEDGRLLLLREGPVPVLEDFLVGEVDADVAAEYDV